MTTSAKGRTEGGARGGRELSLPHPEGCLPAPTSENSAQGGRSSGKARKRKSPQTGDAGTGSEAPSLLSEATPLTVHLPTELPQLTPPASRALLGALIELTAVEILDAAPRLPDSRSLQDDAMGRFGTFHASVGRLRFGKEEPE